MHSFTRHLHREIDVSSATQTKGLILDQGWRYDLGMWFMDIFMFRGQLRQIRQRTVSLALLQPGEVVLDVGCGTGTLALEAKQRVGRPGRVVGVDPGAQQIARARTMATRRRLQVDFEIGVIEQIPFPDQMFDVVLSTLMMHHLPKNLKRQGLAEIARVLKPGGRLIIADFTRKQERSRHARRFHAGGSSMPDLVDLVSEAGFKRVETEVLRPSRLSTFPGAGFVRAYKSSDNDVEKQ